MLHKLAIKFAQFTEKIRNQGLLFTIKEIIFFDRTAITFYKNISDFTIDSETLKKIEPEIINISQYQPECFYPFATKSRGLKAITNTKKGYEAFLFIRNKEVVGDCWFASSLNTNIIELHHDIKLFKITPELKSAYMFDMFVKSEERGTNVTSSILKYAFYCFKKRGITHVYTYVMSHNTPAIWMVRTLGFKELNKLKMSRLFFFRRTK